MNKMKFLTISIVILLLLNATTLFIIFHQHLNQLHNHRDDNATPAQYIIDQLKLDADQQKKFDDLKRQHHEQANKFHDEDRRLHDQYFALLKTDNPDKSKVDSLATLMVAERKNMEVLTFEHFQQLRNICRSDQKKLFDNTIDEIMRMMAEHAPPH